MRNESMAITSPALACASYPLVDLPSGDTLLRKLFPSDKFIKLTISRYSFSDGKSIMFSAKNRRFI